MEIKKVNNIYSELKKFDDCRKDGDYISITEWANGEGYDIDLNGKLISLHELELEAINYLTRTLIYGQCTNHS